MPELPEVETIRRGLEPVLVGTRLANVVLYREDLRFPFPDHFAQGLEGAEVVALKRRAKYLLIRLSTRRYWVTHLGMTGRFTIDADSAGKHEHLVLEAVGSGRRQRIAYQDPRRFGYMDLIPVDEIAKHRWFESLGPEPLGPDFNGRYLEEVTAKRKRAIKNLLLDQRVVAGLGNIYVCEALFRAGISPTEAAGAVKAPQLETLVGEVKAVLREALAAGGSTLRDFANVEGGQGYFQHTFTVYGREGEPCISPGCSETIARQVQSGRSTFYCPNCQADFSEG